VEKYCNPRTTEGEFVSPILYAMLVLGPKCICLHFDLLNFSNHLSDHFNKLSISFGKLICCFSSSVIYKKEAIQLENVQRRATKLIKNIQHKTYTQRLKYLGLPSLQYRRLRADMIETYKIVQLALESVDCLRVYYFLWYFVPLIHNSLQKLYFLTFVLQFFLYNFLLWPLVVVWFKGFYG
jgi:hypothetical protein